VYRHIEYIDIAAIVNSQREKNVLRNSGITANQQRSKPGTSQIDQHTPKFIDKLSEINEYIYLSAPTSIKKSLEQEEFIGCFRRAGYPTSTVSTIAMPSSTSRGGSQPIARFQACSRLIPCSRYIAPPSESFQQYI
jgi:hypothetical protein